VLQSLKTSNMNENKTGWLTSWQKDLEQELEQLKAEKEREKEEVKKGIISLTKQELAEIERKNAEKLKELETKLRQLYYWLWGTSLVFLAIIAGMFFYLRGR
jgi:hypothetical protein